MAKIVLIDESPWMMIHMNRVLEEEGHEVYFTSDGEHALRLVKENSPELILTDVVMPRKDGFEIIAHMKKEFPWIKIIAMSSKLVAYADQYLLAMRAFGVDLTVKKPFRDIYLINAVNSVLEEKKIV